MIQIVWFGIFNPTLKPRYGKHLQSLLDVDPLQAPMAQAHIGELLDLSGSGTTAGIENGRGWGTRNKLDKQFARNIVRLRRGRILGDSEPSKEYSCASHPFKNSNICRSRGNEAQFSSATRRLSASYCENEF
jgi:hypothetical protein